MSWEIQKRILLAVLVLLLLLLSFVIGVSFGLSFGESYFLSALYPALSVLGNWVAGIGALAAVFTSLWLAENQRKLNSENLDVKFNLVVLPPDMRNRLMVYVVSNGNKPSNVISLSIVSNNAKTSLWVKDLDVKSNQLPQFLSYGQASSFLLVKDTKSYINSYVKAQCSGRYDELNMVLSTTLGRFKEPFSGEIIEYLQQC